MAKYEADGTKHRWVKLEKVDRSQCRILEYGRNTVTGKKNGWVLISYGGY